MVDTPTFRSEEEIEASANKMLAEAEHAVSEARLAVAKAELVELELDAATIRRQQALEIEEARLASDHHHRTLRFIGDVGDRSVQIAVAQLAEWHRIDPGCDITFVIDSPGGDIIAGFHLFDLLRHMSDDQGHTITTIGMGMAASMGGVILQAGDHRIMGKRASLLIHQASFGAGGSFGVVEDTVEFIKSLQTRILDILAQRSTLTQRQIKTRWERTNWWLTADQALELGFVDEVN